MTVFMSSHILSEVERTCHRVAVIREGELVAMETIDGLRVRAGQVVIVEFEDNVAELEALAADPGGTLDALLARITSQTIESVAFVDIVTAGPADPRLEAVAERVKAAIIGALRAAQRAKTVRRSLTADDVMLAVGMVATLIARTPPAERRAAADSAWALLNRAMHP